MFSEHLDASLNSQFSFDGQGRGWLSMCSTKWKIEEHNPSHSIQDFSSPRSSCSNSLWSGGCLVVQCAINPHFVGLINEITRDHSFSTIGVYFRLNYKQLKRRSRVKYEECIIIFTRSSCTLEIPYAQQIILSPRSKIRLEPLQHTHVRLCVYRLQLDCKRREPFGFTLHSKHRI